MGMGRGGMMTASTRRAVAGRQRRPEGHLMAPDANNVAELNPGLYSDGEMSAGSLAERVVAARGERQMSLSALQRVTGLSARTLRDIESGNRRRRYGADTLGRLDEVFGWRPGTAWQTWIGEDPADAALEGIRQAIAAQMAALEERLARIEEAPPWSSELIDAVRLLRPDDRARVLDYALRLGEGPTWR